MPARQRTEEQDPPIERPISHQRASPSVVDRQAGRQAGHGGALEADEDY